MDGKVPIVEFARILQQKGFQGMLVSDHNSYRGYRTWLKYKELVEKPRMSSGISISKEKKTINQDMLKNTDKLLKSGFVVLKGIEYDTIDAGHILVIMPTGCRLPILELRGLPVQLLIEIVHRNGGILGPAHPCGEKYLSITNTRKHRNQLAVMDQFDFLEGFNACESKESNHRAYHIAKEHQKPAFGGSDAHKEDCIGLAFTEIEGEIHNESDLITCVKKQVPISCGGSFYTGTTKEKLGSANKILVQSFWFYNHMGSMWRHHKRKKEMHRLNLGGHH